MNLSLRGPFSTGLLDVLEEKINLLRLGLEEMIIVLQHTAIRLGIWKH